MSFNLNTVTKAVQTLLNSDATLKALLNGKEVVRGEYVNARASDAPWAGIYRGDESWNPRTLGGYWEVSPSIKIIVQASNSRSSEECEEDVVKIMNAVKQVLINNLTLSSTVDMINDMGVEYRYIEDDQTNMFFQSAIITCNLEVQNQ